jgi:hypothetical protein
MNPEQLRAECREMGKTLHKEIAAAHETINVLARSLKAAFDETVSKEDIAPLEKAIAAIERLLSENA